MKAIHHHHSHSGQIRKVNNAFIIGIILNTLFVIAEVASGFYYHSLALLSDAGHNMADVATLVISLFAFKLAQSKSTQRFTYGFHKGTVLASLINAGILFIAIGSIGWEAIHRMVHPVSVSGKVISLVAAAGILINGFSAWLFFRYRNQELNSKGAFLHMFADAMVSAGVVAAGVVITYSGKTWIDPLISLVIILVVTGSTWSLLKESFRLAMDAVPAAINVEQVRQQILKINGVQDIHHIQIWAMGTTRNAMTAHLKLNNLADTAAIKKAVRHQLSQINIQHTTLETEIENETCHEACD